MNVSHDTSRIVQVISCAEVIHNINERKIIQSKNLHKPFNRIYPNHPSIYLRFRSFFEEEKKNRPYDCVLYSGCRISFGIPHSTLPKFI